MSDVFTGNSVDLYKRESMILFVVKIYEKLEAKFGPPAAAQRDNYIYIY